MPLRDSDGAVRLALRRYLGTRLAPLTVLVVVVTCLSAPLAFFVLGRAALEVRADVTAHEVAGLIRQEVQERPRLWKYDSNKILDHVATFEMPGVDRIVVVDAAGQRIEGSADDVDELRALDALWRNADIDASRGVAGAVWVAISTKKLERDTLALLIGFAALGLAMGGLLYWVPMRAMGKAEGNIRDLVQRLRESQGALGQLNETLEQQVEARSAELREALGELQRKEQHLRELSSRAIALQEAERRGIARELHDSAGQALTAIRIQVQLIGDLLEAKAGADAKTTTMARRTLGMVDGTVEEIRRAVNQLGPAVLDDVGLEAAILRAADDLSDATAVQVECSYDVGVDLDASVETTTYRLVQESLTNVARHADASEVTIDVRADEAALRLTLQDDGKGFDLDAVGPRRRGLVGMRERVELLGGTIEIESAVGKGTRIRAELPSALLTDDDVPEVLD